MSGLIKHYEKYLICVMNLYIKLLFESLRFAFQSLILNKLRTTLSLLGITIGIFSIISVFTLVDSLEYQIQTSIKSLGNDAVYVQKWPWAFGSEFPWWKYLMRPQPKVSEIDIIEKNIPEVESAVYICGGSKALKSDYSVVEGVEMWASSKNLEKVQNLEIEQGRFFTEQEHKSGKNYALLGYAIAQDLFPSGNGLEKTIKLDNRKYTVIGITKKQGESLFLPSFDRRVVIPVENLMKYKNVATDEFNPSIVVKAKGNISMEELKIKLKGVLRASRKIAPKADDNFALNESTLLTQGFDALFGVINLAGGIIGIFSIIVGAFGIANIMFVSVKERTGQVGIQKALGAKKDFILFQFLSESVSLSLIGGIIGLLIILLLIIIANFFFDFSFRLSFNNVLIGIGISFVVGIISGIIPAWQAANLNPVEAIRTNG